MLQTPFDLGMRATEHPETHLKMRSPHSVPLGEKHTLESLQLNDLSGTQILLTCKVERASVYVIRP